MLTGLALDLLQELVDRLVAERSDPDPLPRSHQGHRHLRALPGLARAGRTLNEEVAVPERGDGFDGWQIESHPRQSPLEHRHDSGRHFDAQALIVSMVGDLRESGLDEEADLLDEAAPKLAPEAYSGTVRKNLNYESWQTRRNRRA